MYKIAAFILALLFALPVAGDVLKDADRMLCVPGPVSHCIADGETATMFGACTPD